METPVRAMRCGSRTPWWARGSPRRSRLEDDEDSSGPDGPDGRHGGRSFAAGRAGGRGTSGRRRPKGFSSVDARVGVEERGVALLVSPDGGAPSPWTPPPPRTWAGTRGGFCGGRKLPLFWSRAVKAPFPSWPAAPLPAERLARNTADPVGILEIPPADAPFSSTVGKNIPPLRVLVPFIEPVFFLASCVRH